MAQVVPNDLHQDPLVSSSSQTPFYPLRRTHPIPSHSQIPAFPNSNRTSSSRLLPSQPYPLNSHQTIPNFQSHSNPLVSSSAMPSSDPTANDAQRTVDHSGSGQPNSNGPISPSDDPAAMLDPQSLQTHPRAHPHSRSHPMPHVPYSSSDRSDLATTAGMSSASLSAAVSQKPNDSSGDPNGSINSINPSYHSSVNAPRSSGPPVMGMMNSFADMTLGAPIPYATPMPLMPMQPHVMPLVPPQHVQQMSHRQPPPPAIVPNQRTTACHWVPQDRVGAVIGGHGAVIRTLQEKSGATIQVHNETIRGDMKLFTIYGFPTQIESAVQLIDDIVGRTRPALNSPSDQNSAFLSHTQRPNDLFKTIFVPTSCVGLVIGRNGDTIRNLQDRSGADIKVTPDQQVQPGHPSRSILLTGSEEAISIAQRLIMDIVVDASRRNPYPAPVVGSHVNGDLIVMAVLHVQNEKVGLIIGRKGVAIREFQIRSGAKIQVTKDGNSVQADGTRPVMVTGTRAQVEEARKLIATKINVQYLPSHEMSANLGGSGAPLSPMGGQNSSGVGVDSNIGIGCGTSGDGNNGAGSTGASPALGEGAGVGSSTTATPNMQFGFGGAGYDQEYGNGQQGFQTMFDGHDAVAHGRPPVPYVQYIGFSNYAAGMSPHARPMSHNVPMPYGAAPQHHHQQQQQSMQQQQHTTKHNQHTDNVDSVNVSSANASGSLQETYGIEGPGNGKLMFGAYDSSVMFGSSRDQPVMYGRDDRVETAVSSRDGARSKPSGSNPHDNTSASNDNVTTAAASTDDSSTKNAGDAASRMQKMQDNESVSVSAGRKRNEDVSNG